MTHQSLLYILLITSTTISSMSPPKASYNILLVSAIGSESHRFIFKPIVELLAERGHKVTMMMGLPISKEITHPNITQLRTGITPNKDNPQMFAARSLSFGDRIDSLRDIVVSYIKMAYDNENVQQMYTKRKEFDLIIMDELLNEIFYPFIQNMPFVFISTAGLNFMTSAGVGNILNPAYYGGLYEEYPRPYSLYHRIINTVNSVYRLTKWKYWSLVPAVQDEISKLFPNLPPLLELERNASLMFMNSHPLLELSVPILPSQIHIGGIHCRPGNKLNQDVQRWIEGAEHGVIFFSLGSIIMSSSIPQEYKTILLKAFSKLKQRILWKHEEELEDMPSNVLVQKWTNQQDVLAHPNVKLFITHGGMLSVTEGVYHKTPMLVFPVVSDGHKNGFKITNMNIGRSLLWDEMTPEVLVDTIEDIIYKPQYLATINVASEYLRDHLEPPAEKAVWWLEYVIRHKGAAPLRSPAADLPWWQLLMLDAVVLFHIVGAILCYGCARIVKYWSSSKYKVKKKKKTH